MNFIIQWENNYRLLRIFTAENEIPHQHIQDIACKQESVSGRLSIAWKMNLNSVNWDMTAHIAATLASVYLQNLQHKNCWSKSVIKKKMLMTNHSSCSDTRLLWSWMCLLWSICNGSGLMSIVYHVLYLEVVNAQAMGCVRSASGRGHHSWPQPCHLQ